MPETYIHNKSISAKSHFDTLNMATVVCIKLTLHMSAHYNTLLTTRATHVHQFAAGLQQNVLFLSD